jgi:hypothetical protein
MPGALRNPKHEQFAQLIVQAPKRGLSNAECYRQAGYRVAAGPACDVSASRLLSSDKVQARIRELVEPTVKKTRATVDTLAEQFDRVFDGALKAEQFGAAGNAAGLKARLLGFMRTQIEIGSPGAFDGLETTEAVVAALLSDMTASEALQQLDTLRELIEHHAAVVVAAKPPRAPGSEANQALAYLRLGRR